MDENKTTDHGETSVTLAIPPDMMQRIEQCRGDEPIEDCLLDLIWIGVLQCQRRNDLKRMVRRLTLKLERLDGKSLATEDARRLFDFDTAPRSQVEIEEAEGDLHHGQ